MRGFGECFADLPDPRAENALHDLTEILFIALLATLCGAMSCTDMALFARMKTYLWRDVLVLKNGLPSHDTFSRVPFRVLDENVETASGHISIGTMHLAKGLEFRAVAVMDCDDEIVPLQARIENVGDEGDLQEVYDTERQLLYVACTRARDRLSVSAVEPASEFLDDVRG